MTAPNLQDTNVLLILGEVRGDVKGIVKSLSSLEANINAVEDASDIRFSKIESRISQLEQIKTRVGGLALGVGIAAGATSGTLIAFVKATLMAIGG
jgi:hypothetical protein